MKIGMVGSRSLSPQQCREFAALAEALAGSHTIVSGGCPRGADKAALQGARAAEGRITLCLDPTLHKDTYPMEAIEYATNDDRALARQFRADGPYFGYFARNATIARISNALIAWGTTNGTQHTIQCARTLGKPLLLLHRATWSSTDELITRVLIAIDTLERGAAS